MENNKKRVFDSENIKSKKARHDDPYHDLKKRQKEDMDSFYSGMKSCIRGTTLDIDELEKLYDTTPYSWFQPIEVEGNNVLEKIAGNPFLYLKYKELNGVSSELSLPLYDDKSYVERRQQFAFTVVPFVIADYECIIKCLEMVNGVRVLSKEKLKNLIKTQDEENLIEIIRESKYKNAFDFITHRFSKNKFEACQDNNYVRIAEQYVEIRRVCTKKKITKTT